MDRIYISTDNGIDIKALIERLKNASEKYKHPVARIEEFQCGYSWYPDLIVEEEHAKEEG